MLFHLYFFSSQNTCKKVAPQEISRKRKIIESPVQTKPVSPQGSLSTLFLFCIGTARWQGSLNPQTKHNKWWNHCNIRYTAGRKKSKTYCKIRMICFNHHRGRHRFSMYKGLNEFFLFLGRYSWEATFLQVFWELKRYRWNCIYLESTTHFSRPYLITSFFEMYTTN